jgi:hypothetical protein
MGIVAADVLRVAFDIDACALPTIQKAALFSFQFELADRKINVRVRSVGISSLFQV